MNAIINASEELLIFSLHRNILHIGAIMAAFFDDKPLVAGINEDWDEQTTGRQIMRPEWDFSPIRMHSSTRSSYARTGIFQRSRFL